MAGFFVLRISLNDADHAFTFGSKGVKRWSAMYRTRLRTSRSVWTEDKGNSQTGDMGDSGTMGARVV